MKKKEWKVQKYIYTYICIIGTCQSTDKSYLGNQLKLLHIISPRKERFSGNDLSHNATNRPHIYGSSILRAAKKKLRCTVPACDNILSHEIGLRSGSGKPEISNLQVTVGI